VSTQLRLVDTSAPAGTSRARGAAGTSTRPARGRVSRGRTAGAGRGTPVRWGEWQLDARTRRVGREGVARARRALAAVEPDHGPAPGDELSRAS